ncbi:MAG: DUF1428 domain-containing protein [Proteobacteria bacterium]|jgi:uncharacterized protein YbaA (DUF1428 family)|nr:DUF1428 domain-containing protein [Pseudomonadota bacterium]
MARYVDGFVIPIKKKNIAKYKKMATVGRNAWMKHGALDYYETVGDDLKNQHGTTFTKMCKLKSDETVVFAYIVFKSKAHRNRVNKKVHAEFAKMSWENFEMPFDMKRTAYAGFTSIVNSK